MQEFDYEVFEEDGVKKARVQSAGVVTLEGREGSDEEVIKNYINSTLNVAVDDIDLNRKDNLDSGVITSQDTNTDNKEKTDPVESVKRTNKR